MYLDGAMTNGDLQNLTDEFYRNIQKKLGALGIEFVDWSAIQNTEYYADRQAKSDEKKTTNGDAKSGQGWVSFTANDGPVFMRYSVHERLPEPIAYSKAKNLSKTAEAIIGADLMTLDVVLDFTSINLATGVDTSWVDGTKYLNYQADYRIAPIMSVPESYALFYTQKNKFDIYNSKLPVVTRDYFSGKPYEDANKAALKMRTFFCEPRFTFTPVVIEADRDLYIAAARNALTAYADLFVEKMRLLRGGTVLNAANKKPADNTTMKQVTDEARKNRDTTPETTDELTAAIAEAEKQNKFQLAVGYYGELMKLNPDEAQNYVNRGVIYLNELSNFKAAAADFSKAIEIKITNPIVFYNRGTAYIKLSDWKKAVKDFDAFIAIQPDYANGYLNRGMALLNLKKTGEAIEDFNRGIRIDPRLPNLYCARAVAYQVKGNTTMAQADELKAAQLERGQ